MFAIGGKFSTSNNFVTGNRRSREFTKSNEGVMLQNIRKKGNLIYLFNKRARYLFVEHEKKLIRFAISRCTVSFCLIYDQPNGSRTFHCLLVENTKLDTKYRFQKAKTLKNYFINLHTSRLTETETKIFFGLSSITDSLEYSQVVDNRPFH